MGNDCFDSLHDCGVGVLDVGRPLSDRGGESRKRQLSDLEPMCCEASFLGLVGL